MKSADIKQRGHGYMFVTDESGRRVRVYKDTNGNWPEGAERLDLTKELLSSMDSVVDQFETGQLPEVMAKTLNSFLDAEPCHGWSWRNQILAGIFGDNEENEDPRSNWGKFGRTVDPGTWNNPFLFIMKPLLKKVWYDDDGKKAFFLTPWAYEPIPVYPFECTTLKPGTRNAKLWKTEKERMERINSKKRDYISTLPFTEVLERWNIALDAGDTKVDNAYGWYIKGRKVKVGVDSLMTFLHELVHAADFENGTLVENGNVDTSETVAMLGAACLGKALGCENKELDMQHSWDYIVRYAGNDESKARDTMMSVLKRTTDALDLIIKTALLIENEDTINRLMEEDDNITTIEQAFKKWQYLTEVR